MPFYQRLVALDLYSVFVFLFNYLGLYEDAGFNLSRFILVLYINTIIFVPYFFYDFVTYFLFSVNFLMVIFGDIILSVLPVQADSVWYFIS